MDSDLIGKRFVLTGTLSRKRAEVRQDLERRGAVVITDVSSTTDVLVAGARPGSKLARARSLGVAVWSEDELDAALASATGQHPNLAAAARQKLRESATAAGVEWSRYEPLVRDRILVHARKDEPRRYGGLGQSRFGGCADLLGPDAWPRAHGLDFVFVCQIALADVAELDVANRLPSAGLLSFFVGTPDVMDNHTEHRVEGRVVYSGTSAELRPVWRTAGMPRQRGMELILAPAPPPWNSNLVGNDDPTYCDWYDAWGDGEPIRTAMLGFDRPYESELRPNEEMLLSCWNSENIDYPFYEAVTLSFAIDREALAARDWSAVRCWEGSSI